MTVQRTGAHRAWWTRPWRGQRAVLGPLENPVDVLRERVRLDASLLEEAELADEAEPSVADLELAAMREAEAAADRGAEARMLVTPAERDAPDSLTPEGLESLIEGAPRAAEKSLHVDDALEEARLDMAMRWTTEGKGNDG